MVFSDDIDIITFTFKGKLYRVDKTTELESVAGKRRIQIITKDKRKFTLTFNESVYKWIITE